MTGWRNHRGLATALDIENVDTDQLIPARFMSTPRAEGYGRFLLYDLRFKADGTARPDFPLHRYNDISILIGRRNFGSGSSREAAVYALADYGIRVVIAPSFGDIFAANCINNGLLPALVSERDAELLIAQSSTRSITISVDIEARQITCGAHIISFEISAAAAQKLINGWDDIDLTQQHHDSIAVFRAQRNIAAPWVFAPAEHKEDRALDPSAPR